ncbi:MAG: NUDIX domain-containing protein [Paludibacter sp.]|jgi:ADP-ribose pyrophosphatase YjhB (NUDIX family)|nr:NUDIX domain-containing protein [Paludibacter sp.]
MKFDRLFRFCPVCGSDDFVQYNVKSKRCNHCGFIMYVNPSAAVGAFILNPKDELLVCVRANEPSKGKWDLPGGFVDDHETAEQAIVREIQEELGMKVDAGTCLFTEPNEYTYSGWTLPTLDIFFLFEVEAANPVPADDVADCFFVPLNEVDVNRFGFLSVQRAVTRLKNEYQKRIKIQ